MVDNFDRIKQALVFDNEDEFYHLQILKRRKEHPALGRNSVLIKTYYISSIEYLDQKADEIINLCEFHNARGCINLNRRSFEQLALQTLRKVADQILNKDYRSARKAYESVCGAYMKETNKKWIIDIDTKDPEDRAFSLDAMFQCDPIGDKVIFTLETKNVYHQIVKPFNVLQYQRHYAQPHQVGEERHEIPDIQKNNPTIIYIP